MVNKNIFSILVILMSLSLIGIIFVQAYYINNILKTKEEQDIVIITLLSLDYILTVTAPEALRIQRIIEREHTPLAKIKAVMSNQLQDSEKTAKSDFVILNIDLDSTNKQVYEIHNRINKELSNF